MHLPETNFLRAKKPFQERWTRHPGTRRDSWVKGCDHLLTEPQADPSSRDEQQSEDSWLTPLHQALQVAKERLLSLPDDWDEMGSPGYLEETWKRAHDFLSLYANKLWRERCLNLRLPAILPGPDGGIDLHWNDDHFEMLVHIPADPNTPAAFYADDKKGTKQAKGTIAPESKDADEGLLEWLR